MVEGRAVMARRHFTLDEVEALVPDLERICIHMLQLRAGLRGAKTPDPAALRGAIEAWLRAGGLDPASDPDLKNTAARVTELWRAEFLAGYAMDPAEILSSPVLGEADPEVVVVGGLRFH